jgi:hypothetical protein
VPPFAAQGQLPCYRSPHSLRETQPSERRSLRLSGRMRAPCAWSDGAALSQPAPEPCSLQQDAILSPLSPLAGVRSWLSCSHRSSCGPEPWPSALRGRQAQRAAPQPSVPGFSSWPFLPEPWRWTSAEPSSWTSSSSYELPCSTCPCVERSGPPAPDCMLPC